jgi:hypothetical protein
MVRSGARRNLPLYMAGGMLIALFGIPLGFGGMAVLAGLMAALAAFAIIYYTFAGIVLLVGAVFMLFGVVRVLLPGVWDKLVALGLIQMNGLMTEFIDHLSPTDQGLLMILIAAMFAVSGLGMLRLGKHLLRGLRFLFNLVVDGLRRFGQGVRQRLRQNEPAHVTRAKPYFDRVQSSARRSRRDLPDL